MSKLPRIGARVRAYGNLGSKAGEVTGYLPDRSGFVLDDDFIVDLYEVDRIEYLPNA